MCGETRCARAMSANSPGAARRAALEGRWRLSGSASDDFGRAHARSSQRRVIYLFCERERELTPRHKLEAFAFHVSNGASLNLFAFAFLGLALVWNMRCFFVFIS